jgi:hypothetical protein
MVLSIVPPSHVSCAGSRTRKELEPAGRPDGPSPSSIGVSIKERDDLAME